MLFNYSCFNGYANMEIFLIIRWPPTEGPNVISVDSVSADSTCELGYGYGFLSCVVEAARVSPATVLDPSYLTGVNTMPAAIRSTSSDTRGSPVQRHCGSDALRLAVPVEY